MSQQSNLVESVHKRHDLKPGIDETDDIQDEEEELDPRVQVRPFSDIKFSDNLQFSDYFTKTVFQFTT